MNQPKTSQAQFLLGTRKLLFKSQVHNIQSQLVDKHFNRNSPQTDKNSREMATNVSSLSSSRELPQRLMNFFARFPPKLYSAQYTGASIPLTRPKRSSQPPSNAPPSNPAALTALSTSSSDPNASMIESTSTTPPETPSSSLSTEDLPPNPFLPWRNPETNRWRAPHFSLRRQADLVKLAQKHGVESLLPPSRKSSVFKEARILEKGLRVRGTGEGQKVKGHKWERQMPAKLEARRKAMEGMPEMIRLWKQVSLILTLAGKDCGY